MLPSRARAFGCRVGCHGTSVGLGGVSRDRSVDRGRKGREPGRIAPARHEGRDVVTWQPDEAWMREYARVAAEVGAEGEAETEPVRPGQRGL